MTPRALGIGPPKSTFSALDLLERGLLEGRVVAPGQERRIAEPQPLRKLAGLGQDKIGSSPIFWTRHPNARLVGNTLVVQDSEKRICFEGAYGIYGLGNDPAFHYLLLPRPVRLSGNWTSVISQWSNGFYHWLMDALPRLALLRELPPNIRVLVPPDLTSCQQDTLAWLGLEGRYRPTRERHLRIENFYFASPPAMTGCYDPFTPQFLRQSFLKHADTNYHSPRRFYVRRVGQKRGILNEQEVVDFFVRNRWEVVDTAELTMAQQIQLFANAEAICTLHGAALTNLVWCQPGCRVLELVSDTFVNGVYEGLAEQVGVTHRFLLCRGDYTLRARVDMRKLLEEFELMNRV